ncbi:hypothetical protein ACU4GD_42175 [Cupriavidus basilensis]
MTEWSREDDTAQQRRAWPCWKLQVTRSGAGPRRRPKPAGQ